MEPEYGTMKDVGGEYGITSHVVGKLLKKHGFRTEDGKPSARAFELKMVEQKFDDSDHYIWIWHIRKLKMLLEHFGHKPQSS